VVGRLIQTWPWYSISALQAILDATNGAAHNGEVYAAILRSEWRVALECSPPNE